MTIKHLIQSRTNIGKKAKVCVNNYFKSKGNYKSHKPLRMIPFQRVCSSVQPYVDVVLQYIVVCVLCVYSVSDSV